MKSIFKKAAAIMLVMAMAFTLAACSEEEKVITLGEGDWDSNAFHDQVAKFIIENGYDVTVDVVTADTAVMISAMKTGGLDVCLELWSDNVPTYKDDLVAGDYQELSVNYDDNMQGLYVPRYIVEGDNAIAPDLKSVKDLANYADVFVNPENPDMGIIYGGPEGWGATEFLHKKMEVYGLSEMYNFRPIDSGATLAATLSGAYQKGEPWVGYYWEPTWVMGLYDMVLLEDSAYSEENYAQGIGSYTAVRVTVVSTPEFVEEYPEVADFLGNYKTSSFITSSALGYMQENDVEAEATAKWFLKENTDLWGSWVTEEAYEKVMEALNQ